MSNDIIFQKYYNRDEVTIYLDIDIITLHDTYNDHLIKFRIEDIEKYIELCKELQDHEEYDEEEDRYYEPDEIYTDDYDDGFLLSGNYAVPYRLEYYIEAIQETDISKVYNLDYIAKLNKEELENYSTPRLEYILDKINKQKRIKTSSTSLLM